MTQGRRRDEMAAVEEIVKSLAADPRSGDDGDPSGSPGGDPVTLVRRIVVFGAVVLAAYLVLWRGSHLVFAPRPEAVRPLAPSGQVPAGQAVTLGAVVRNHGWSSGAAFAVAALGGGVEIEGPTVAVPARDSAVVPVRVSLGAGHHVVNLVVFDGWRGVRRLRAFPDIPVRVGRHAIEPDAIEVPRRVTRGEVVTVIVPWANRAEIPRRVSPVIVFRRAGGGPPVVVVGEPRDVGPEQLGRMELEVDTWILEPGTWEADVRVRADDGQRLGRARERRVVEVRAP